MASDVQRFVDVRILPLILVLSLATSVGCDDGASRGAGADADRIESGYYTNDGGFTYLPSDDGTDSGSGGPPGADAGVGVGWGDAGLVAPDGGIDSDAGAPQDPDAGTPDDAGPSAADDCAPSDCGTMPSGTFPCFDGADARIECSPYLGGTCEWQFVCGD